MAKTIVLNDIEIINMNYNVSAGKLAIEYALIDDQGVQHEWDYAIFWREMPPEADNPTGPEEPYPPVNWHVLDATNKNNKDKLVADVKQILKAIVI